jgi:hypothetical protein
VARAGTIDRGHPTGAPGWKPDPHVDRKEVPAVSLLYRAIWQDDPDRIHERARAAFAWWVRKHHPGDWTFAPGVAEASGQADTLVRTGSGEAGSIQRCSLHVDDGDTRFTTTLITTRPEHGPASVWVDRERVSRRSFSTFTVQAPALSTRLITSGIDPRRGPVPLTAAPRALRPDEIADFVSLLRTPDRDLPLVVYAATPEVDPNEVLAAGVHAARVLAGSAAVYLLSAVGRGDLAERLGDELTVAPGAVRVYLPGVSPDEPNPSRHRHLEAERVQRDPLAVPHTIIQLLAPAIAARRAPAEYPVLRPLLEADPEAVDSERAELAARVADLEQQLSVADDRVLELLADLEDAEGRVNLLQAALARSTSGGASVDRPAVDAPPPDVDGLAAAARAAQRYLTGIVLPDDACRDLAELDRRIEAGTWGRAAWRGLLALDAFARDTDFRPGFWEWCRANRSAFGWPATQKKLAMRESQTVMATETLRAKRLFPVDEAVAPSGRVEMQAHLKIAEGGNHQIPRIYFHDDRHGPTGKVHIGYFGPHRHVPNTLT